MTQRPRGVRVKKPICIKYGSHRSSRVTASSPNAAARVSRPTGPAAVHLDHGPQQAAVQLIQTGGIHIHPLQAQQSHFLVNDAIAQHGGKVPHTL